MAGILGNCETDTERGVLFDKRFGSFALMEVAWSFEIQINGKALWKIRKTSKFKKTPQTVPHLPSHP